MAKSSLISDIIEEQRAEKVFRKDTWKKRAKENYERDILLQLERRRKIMSTTPITDEKKAEVIALLAEGNSMKKVAEIAGVSESSVFRIKHDTDIFTEAQTDESSINPGKISTTNADLLQTLVIKAYNGLLDGDCDNSSANYALGLLSAAVLIIGKEV